MPSVRRWHWSASFTFARYLNSFPNSSTRFDSLKSSSSALTFNSRERVQLIRLGNAVVIFVLP